MAGHTPGPWALGRASDARPHCVYGPVSWRYDGSSVGLIVEVKHHGFSDPHAAPEQEANARLIAAAPELLEALLALRDGPMIECVDDNRVQGMIRAAIAKATQP